MGIYLKYSVLSTTALLALATSAFGDEPWVAAKGAPVIHNFNFDTTPINRSDKLRIAFSLSGFNQAGADAFIQSQRDPKSPNFHHWISTAEFGKRFGAGDADVNLITNFLTKSGFKDLRIGAGRSFISATGTFDLAEKTFHTKLQHFRRPWELVAKGEPTNFYGPSSPILLPKSIADRTDGVIGLTNLALMHPSIQGVKPMQSAVSYVPAQIAKAYGNTYLQGRGYLGQGQKIAVFSPTQRYLNDPYDFVKALGQLAQFNIYDIFIDGGPADGGGSGEAALDLEVIIGQAPKITVLMMSPYIGTTDKEYMTGTLDGYDAVGVIGGVPVLSSSWDLEEGYVIAEGASSYATAFQNVCASLAASGVSIFNSSGDAAAYSNTGSKIITTKLETSCPYLTSVGGTTLALKGDNSYLGETLWAFSGTTAKPEGGGGGISRLFARPSWQTGPGTTNAFSNGHREEPDVSADADPASGYEIITNGQAAAYGGTSASTPLWAISTVLMEQAYADGLKTPQVFLGLLNPAYYQLGTWFENSAQDYPGSFYLYHDITTGNNGKYPTTPGYDMCAGWGSADFSKMYQDLGYFEKIPGFSPDFVPYKPTGAVSGIAGAWTSPLMIHTGTAAVTEPASFSHLVSYNISAAIANLSYVDGPLSTVGLLVDGKLVYSTSVLAMPSYTYSAYAKLTAQQFTAGNHTISLVANYGLGVRETTTSNNTYARTIHVL